MLPHGVHACQQSSPCRYTHLVLEPQYIYRHELHHDVCSIDTRRRMPTVNVSEYIFMSLNSTYVYVTGEVAEDCEEDVDEKIYKASVQIYGCCDACHFNDTS